MTKPLSPQAKIINRQTYVQADGSIHYLHRCFSDRNLQPIITMFRIVDHPEGLTYKYLRFWKYIEASDLCECPHCKQTTHDVIQACRFHWMSGDPLLNWLAECPICRGWSVVTG